MAGVTLMPSTMSLISTMFQDDRQRTVAISVWLSCFTGGTAIGPLVGGLMLEFFWWGSVFLLAVPVMVVLLVLGPILLPEYRNPSPGRLKLGSVAMLLIATLMVVYSLKRFAELGLNTLPVLFLVGGLVIGFVFVQRQRKLAEPLLDMRLFAGRAFSASLATMTLAIFAMAGAAFFLQQYLQMVAGLSPFQAGLVGLPIPIMMIISTMLTPALARRVQPAVLMATGLVIASVGLALLTLATPESGFTILVVGGVVQALGLGPTLALGTDMIIGSAPPEKAGAASAISETGAEMGTALGIAVLGSIGTAVYRSDVADQVPPGVPDGIAQAARDTVGAAVSAAGNLPERLGEPLLAAAREAFTHGLQVAAGVAVATTLGIAVLAAILLRGVRPSSGYEQAEAAGSDDGASSGDGSDAGYGDGVGSGDGARGGDGADSARGVEEQALQRD